MAKTNKKSKAKKSAQLLNLFQNKVFIIVFFLVAFSVVGGALYLWKSSAATPVTASYSKCVVSGRVNVGGVLGISVVSDGVTLQGIKYPSRGKYKIPLTNTLPSSGIIYVNYTTDVNTYRLGSFTAGPC